MRLVVQTRFVAAGRFVNWQTITFVAGIVLVKQTTRFVPGIAFVKQTNAPAAFVMQRTKLVAGNGFVKQVTNWEPGKRFVRQTNLFVAGVTTVSHVTTLVRTVILLVEQRVTLVKQLCRFEFRAVTWVRSIWYR